jgi:DNA-binding LytR/AlgR family response regulator
MQTICIAICEDDARDALELRRLIKQSGVSAEIHTYESADVFLAAFKPGFFQLIFLDIMFGDANAEGIEAALKIRETDDDVWLVFTTNSPDYAVFGYKVRADRYLKKPLDELEVTSLLERATKHFSDISDEIIVTADRKHRSLRLRDIRYVEAHNKQSLIHLKDETIVSYTTIDELKKRLKLPSFLRCHRSYIVNMDHIQSVERDFIMDDGDVVYIGHGNQWNIRKVYRDYIARLARTDDR